MDVILDKYRLGILSKRIKEEISLNTKLNDILSESTEFDESTRTKIRSLGTQISFSSFEERILRELLTGTADGILPSEKLESHILANTSLTNKTIDVDKLKESPMNRNSANHILSYEESEKNDVRWLEIPLNDMRYHANKFQYVLDTRFKEFFVDENNVSLAQIEALKREIESYKAVIESLQSMNAVYAESNELLASDKAQLEQALDRAEDALNDLMKAQEDANKALQEKLKESANASAGDNDVKDLLGDLLDKLSEKPSGDKPPEKESEVRTPIITSINPVKFSPRSAFTLTVNGKNFNKNSVIVIEPHGKVDTLFIDSNTLTTTISSLSAVSITLSQKKVSVMNVQEDGTKLVSKDAILNVDLTEGNNISADTSNVRNTPAS